MFECVFSQRYDGFQNIWKGGADVHQEVGASHVGWIVYDGSGVVGMKNVGISLGILCKGQGHCSKIVLFASWILVYLQYMMLKSLVSTGWCQAKSGHTSTAPG